MFYAREAPDRAPFVEQGQHFDEGDPLFVIEVMKMFNKVHAPFAGTVERILIDTDATIVKKGQAVFKVTPDEEISLESETDKRAMISEQTDLFLSFIGVMANMQKFWSASTARWFRLAAMITSPR